jgi:hypothetical protein
MSFRAGVRGDVASESPTRRDGATDYSTPTLQARPFDE